MATNTNQALSTALGLLSLSPAPYVGPAQRVGKFKKPSTPNGYKDYSNDPEVVRDLFAKYPGDHVAVWAGPSRLIIEDIDQAGWNTVGRMEDTWESTLYYDTPNGGQHHVWPGPSYEEAPASVAPIRGYDGVDRRSGDGMALWYGGVPSQEEWDRMRAQEPPTWLTTGRAKVREKGERVRVETADVEEVQTWLDGLTDGPAIEELVATTEHYSDAVAAITNLAEFSRMFPTVPGLRETWEVLADGYVNSPVATSEDRERKVLDIARWALGKTAGVHDHTKAMQWAQKLETAHEAKVVEAKLTASLMETSWVEEDFSDVLDGTYEEPEPCVLVRTDGVALFYPGLVNDLHGESESGKSWVCVYAAVQEVKGGRHVRYVDYESNRATLVKRMLLLGASPDQLRKFFHYYRPSQDPLNVKPDDPQGYAIVRDFEALLGSEASLIVMDGVTEALAVSGLGAMDSEDWARFQRIPKALAKDTGAAVVLIDHVSKGGNAGRFAFGTQHKMASIDGASYVVDVDEGVAPGKVGTLKLSIAKDRNGVVRAASGKFSKSDRLQVTALFELDSTAATHSTATLKPWNDSSVVAGEAKALNAQRATVLGFFQTQPSYKSKSEFTRATGMEWRDADSALQMLADDGLIRFTGSGKPGSPTGIEWIGDAQ